MFLVDTSVWIKHFSRNDPFDLRAVCGPDDRVLCPPVYQEILQGLRDDSLVREFRSILGAAEMVENPMGLEVWAEASELYRSARRRGLSVRSSVDCLIAACALRHQLTVLHDDRDYDVLSQVSSLKVQRISP